ncbi:MAG TPA: AAA family ATPase [Trebonia sp.]
MDQIIAVIGPPAVGKTTLTTRLGEASGCTVFRLREHVPHPVLAAASADPDRVDWIDDLTVTRVLRAYVGRTIGDKSIYTVLFDNFPGSALQVELLLGVLSRLAPACGVTAVELHADEHTRQQRVETRRVCHTCEHDPVHDPRLPAAPSSSDPWRCARCGGLLHPRRGDAPRLFSARTARFEAEAPALRQALADAGIAIVTTDAGRPAEAICEELSPLTASRSLSS